MARRRIKESSGPSWFMRKRTASVMAGTDPAAAAEPPKYTPASALERIRRNVLEDIPALETEAAEKEARSHGAVDEAQQRVYIAAFLSVCHRCRERRGWCA
jgi:hypothetical protein